MMRYLEDEVFSPAVTRRIRFSRGLFRVWIVGVAAVILYYQVASFRRTGHVSDGLLVGFIAVAIVIAIRIFFNSRNAEVDLLASDVARCKAAILVAREIKSGTRVATGTLQTTLTRPGRNKKRLPLLVKQFTDTPVALGRAFLPIRLATGLSMEEAENIAFLFCCIGASVVVSSS